MVFASICEHASSVFIFASTSTCQIVLKTMRAVAKFLRVRASEHPCNFCEQFVQRPNFTSTLKLNGTIRYFFNALTVGNHSMLRYTL